MSSPFVNDFIELHGYNGGGRSGFEILYVHRAWIEWLLVTTVRAHRVRIQGYHFGRRLGVILALRSKIQRPTGT